MNGAEIIDILLGAVAMLGGAIIKYMFSRVRDNTDKLDQLRISMATQGQENKELYSHIQRMDSNITEIYRKLDDLLIAVNRKN